MIVRPVSRLVQELDAKSFTVIGCACHGGLGAEAMHFLRSGLSGAEGDFIAVVGDIVPLGRDPFYHTMAQFIDAYAPKPVHVLKCNHDGPDFDECFGHPNRAVIAEECVLIMLDNSERRFSDETLAFLCETMAVVDSHNVIVAFHIPPPNRISGNTMDVEEWQRFEEAVGVWRSRISLLLCGHEHCYYEDDIDGLRLVASGGTAGPGDWVERVAPGGQHALEISFGGDGRPIVRTRALDAAMDAEHCGEVRSMLVRAFDLQCRDHVSMRLWSEEARGRGEEGMARLYRAASESALIQGRILHRLLTGGRSGPEEQPAASARADAGGNAERGGGMFLAHALECGDRTRANTLSILRAARTDGARKDSVCLLCGSCAMLFVGRESPNYCSACGAPYYALREVK